MNSPGLGRNAILLVLVAAMGYFVDIYDLILFSVVRVRSLTDLGYTSQTVLRPGILLLNLQMGGMLVGGILFGIIGDRKGRLKVLFGSILLYSIANIANAFVQDLPLYAFLRFVAGVGLAGELGAGITLVAEALPRDKRGLGTSLVAAVGISGALFAWFVSEQFNWRTAYLVGGGLGVGLLFLRIGVFESSLFQKVQSSQISRGDFRLLFTSWSRLRRYLGCIAVGIPLWYTVGILMTLAPEFSKVLHVSGEITGGKAIFYNYSGLVVGDVLSGLISQALRSRKKAILGFTLLWTIGTMVYFFSEGLSPNAFYNICFALGIFCGYWALFVTVAAEQFGTNLRATVATTTPNFVRGSVVPLTGLLTLCTPRLGLWTAGLLTGALTLVVALWGYFQLNESFATDLDFESQ